MAGTQILESLCFLVSKAYYAQVPTTGPIWKHVQFLLVKFAEIGPKESEVYELGRALLAATFYHKLMENFPPSPSHQLQVLSWLMEQFHDREWQIGPEMKNVCNDVNLTEADPEFTYKSYLLSPAEDTWFNILESSSLISHGSTGMCTWCGSLLLAEWCLDNQDLLSGKTVLELGSGLGLTGLCIIKLCCPGPKSYTFTDCHPLVLRMLDHNVNINLFPGGVNGDVEKLEMPKLSDNDEDKYTLKAHYKYSENKDVKVENLDWRQVTECQLAKVDVVIASDVVYDLPLMAPLLHLLRLLLKPRGSRDCSVPAIAYLVCTRRNHETLACFLQQLPEHSLTYELIYQETLSIDQALFGYNETYKPINLYKVQHI